MRRIVICAAMVLVVGAAAPAQAATTFNSTGSQEEVSASWSFDDGAGGFVSGNAFAVQVKGGGSFLDFFEATTTPIVCEDGSDGVHFELVFGTGVASVVVDKQYRSGSGAGILDLTVESFDECFGPPFATPNNGGGVVIEDVPVSIHVTATSSLSMSRSSSGFHVPGEINESFRFDARQRSGSGVVTWGDNERAAEFASVGKLSWKFHSNS